MPQIAVLHIPHSSRNVPAKERQANCLDDVHLNNELLRMTDADLCGSVRHLGLLVLAYMIPFALTVEQAASPRELDIHVLGRRPLRDAAHAGLHGPGLPPVPWKSCGIGYE